VPDTQSQADLKADVRVRTIAVVGATGAVGAEMLKCLETAAPAGTKVRALASPRSAGKRLAFRDRAVTVEALSAGSFAGVDIALFAASTAIAKEFAPIAQSQGAVVIDNSSAYRYEDDIPLVVPEVNGGEIARHKGIIANPNCTAALMTMALKPLHDVTPIVRVIASTYQAASGAGAAAMRELEESTRAYLNGETFTPQVLPHPYAFNLFSHNAGMNIATGYNGEEEKVMKDVTKIMRAPDMRIGITCIRVPVLRAHAESLTVEFAKPVSVETARKAIAAFPGVKLVDDRARNYFPMPVDASGGDDVLVGRIREDLSDPSGKTLALFLSGDQLRKGAALNAVQIAARVW
jgi:aspartate-semialdehyde dehydrogenase